MFQRLFLHVSLVFEYLPLFWTQGRFMTSCKGHEFHIFTICVQNWVLRLKLSQGTNFHVSTFISWRVISLCTFSPIFGPKGDLWRHARGHEFHIFTIWVQNWVLRLKLSQCTNFHVSTFISWRVISLCTFSPIFVPKGDLWRHARGHEFHIFTIWVQNWVLRLKLSQCTNFHVSTFISWRVISLCTFSPIFVPKGDLWRHARGHEFHIFTTWVKNWVLRLKLSQCTNFHVSTFISSRVISVWIFAPILVPRGDLWRHARDMNFTFSLYASRIEFSV